MGYHFDADEATADARRDILDKYGRIAQGSAVLVLLAIGLYQWLAPTVFGSRRSAYAPLGQGVELRSPRARHSGAARRPANPDGAQSADEAEEAEGLVAHAGDGGKLEENPLDEDPLDEARLGEVSLGDGTAAEDESAADLPPGTPSKSRSRLGAWLDVPLFRGWKETRRHALVMGLWSAWIVALAFPETGEDYLHLTKRFAQLAASLLPFHYLLGTPSRLSPLPRLFRVSGSSAYNPYHRFHAVLLLGLLFCHASFYLNFYIQEGLLSTRVKDTDVIMGLSMATTLIVLTVLARQTVRYNHRPWFVASHILGPGLICGFLYFHAESAWWYAVEAAVVYGGVVYERLRRRMDGKQ